MKTATDARPLAAAPRVAPRWAPSGAVAVTLILWSSAFVAIRHLRDDFSPGALSLGRLLVGALCLGVVAVSTRGLPRMSRRDALALVAIGVMWFGVYNVALNEGEHRVDAGTASMLLQVSPVLLALLSVVFLSERFTLGLCMGLALAFCGVVLIAGSTSDAPDRDLLGVGLCLVAAVVYSVSVVLQKPLVARLASVHITWIACSVGAIVCLPFAGQLASDVSDAPASSILWVVYLGAFPTAIAFTTYAYALKTMTATNLGVTTYLVPPITVVMGVIALGETPPALAYAGGALALAGVWVARRRPHRKALPSQPQPA